MEYDRQYRSNMQKIQFLLFMRDAGTRTEVLKNVSFDIKKGEKVGIIGLSQSGKSTLMRVLAGVIRPDSGKVIVKGGLTPILDIKLGFDNAMTGRDNYIVMSTALGRSPEEIAENEDSVFEYAGLTDVKNEPMKNYEKGAANRLGFATATALKNDIILYDASLSFGGKARSKKNVERMAELISGDTTFVMIVNRVAEAARLCERGIVLQDGGVIFDGPLMEAVEAYKESNRQILRKKGRTETDNKSVVEDDPVSEENNDDEYV